jgi:hypothetical protein
MLVWLAVLPLVFVILYFFINRRSRSDEVWRLFREQQRQRRRQTPPDQPIDPTFQFDRPKSDDSAGLPRA